MGIKGRRDAGGAHAMELEVIRDALRMLDARDRAITSWLRDSVTPAAAALDAIRPGRGRLKTCAPCLRNAAPHVRERRGGIPAGGAASGDQIERGAARDEVPAALCMTYYGRRSTRRVENPVVCRVGQDAERDRDDGSPDRAVRARLTGMNCVLRAWRRVCLPYTRCMPGLNPRAGNRAAPCATAPPVPMDTAGARPAAPLSARPARTGSRSRPARRSPRHTRPARADSISSSATRSPA